MTETQDRWSVDLVGAKLLERYRVDGSLGEGGMATVYRAVDEQLGIPVVVKVPHVALLAEPGFLERFQMEVEGLVALQHPHIVRIIARGEHDGVPFIVLQGLTGGTLGDVLRGAPEKRVPVDQVLPWLRDVARTLDFIHSQGVVHRDVKPENVMFDEHGNVYLSDFGIAKAIGQRDSGVTVTGTVPGSPAYMAPEQATEKDLAGSADQYALAATVYEALSGAPPFDGDNLVEVLVRSWICFKYFRPSRTVFL